MSTEAPAAAPPAPTVTDPAQEETTHTNQEQSQPRVAPAHQESGQPHLPPRPAQSQYQQYPNSYGQPFQTYQQYGAATAFPNQSAPRWSTLQQQIPPNAQVIPPPPVVEKKSWIISKMSLHGVGFIFGLVILALGITFVNDYSIGLPMIIMNCILGAVAIIWSGAELIVRAVHKLHPGIHPGAHVGVCLIIWLIAAVAGGIQSTLAVQIGYYGYDYYYSDCQYDYDAVTGTREYNCTDNAPVGRDGIMIASATFTWFLWVVYFVLFVLACIDTSRINSARNRPAMVVLQQQPQQGQWGPGQPQMVMAQPPNAYHPSLVPAGGVPRQSMPPQARHSTSRRSGRHSHLPPQHDHVASGAIPEEQEPDVVDKGKQPERADGQDGVREYYTPGTAV